MTLTKIFLRRLRDDDEWVGIIVAPISKFKRPSQQKVTKAARDERLRRNVPKKPNGEHPLAKAIIASIEGGYSKRGR